MGDGVELGRTGLRVSRLTLGCAPLGNLFAPVSAADALATVEAALESRVTTFDAAPLYGNGLAERRLGIALDGRCGVMVSTKVGRRLTPLRGRPQAESIYVERPPFEAEMDYSFDGALRQVENSLQRLGRDRLEVLLIHDYTPREDPRHDPELFAAAMSGAYRALRRLRDEGVVRAVGFGVNHVPLALRFLEAGDFDCAMLAGRYSLLDRSAEERFLPLCQEKGVGVMLAAPFASGILAAPASGRSQARFRYDPPAREILARADRLEQACLTHGMTLRAAALNFPLRHPAVATVVVGCRSADEVRANVGDLGSLPPADLWSEIDALSAPEATLSWEVKHPRYGGPDAVRGRAH